MSGGIFIGNYLILPNIKQENLKLKILILILILISYLSGSLLSLLSSYTFVEK